MNRLTRILLLIALSTPLSAAEPVPRIELTYEILSSTSGLFRAPLSSDGAWSAARTP